MVKSIIKKVKTNIKEIHWPTKKEVFIDTIFTFSTTALLAILIMFWNIGVDKIVQWVLNVL